MTSFPKIFTVSASFPRYNESNQYAVFWNFALTCAASPYFSGHEGTTPVHPQVQTQFADTLPDNKIRCVLVHDYVLLRQGISHLLKDEADIEIVAEAVNAAEALRQVFEYRPDVVIAGAHLFDDADDARRLIRQESPETRVLFLSAGAGHNHVAAKAEGDARASIMLHTSAEEFMEMIRKACPEERSIVREMPRKTSSEWQASESGRPRKRVLTTREREVLKLLAEGRTVRAAAAVLGLSIKTVDAHKFNLMRKLGIHNKAELVMWAIQKRVVKLPANF